ncbi:MAG: hypothetical protein IJ702_08330 [Fretibacterium sp.]|nr:hypothetical protein [Fretibacterium sp.]
MPVMTAQREELSRLIEFLPDDKVQATLDYVLQYFGESSDDGEPPLTEDELEGLRVAEQELSEGKGLQFAAVMKELW